MIDKMTERRIIYNNDYICKKITVYNVIISSYIHTHKTSTIRMDMYKHKNFNI